MIVDYSMNLFFSKINQYTLIFLTVLTLYLPSIEETASQVLSPATKKLFVAINEGNLVQVRRSINNGANYRAENTWGITPVDLAVDKGHLHIVHYLLNLIETQSKNTKFQPLPTPSIVTAPQSTKRAPTKASTFFNNGLSSVAEVYSPPPDSGPWSPTVITRELPSTMNRIEDAVTDEKNNSVSKQLVRKFPISKSTETKNINSREKPKNREHTLNEVDKKGLSMSSKDLEAKPAQRKTTKKSLQTFNKRKLKNFTFVIGRKTTLNKAPLPETSTSSFYQSCINKKFGSLIFCIEKLNWPDNVRAFFQTGNNQSKDTHTIVRYDRGLATYFHTFFPSKSYAQIIKFFTQRYGIPTKTQERSIAPLAEKRRVNPIVTWQGISPTTKLLTTLEVRMYDDKRGSFPDTKRGAVYLYNEKSQTIFPHVSLVELMLLRAGNKP